MSLIQMDKLSKFVRNNIQSHMRFNDSIEELPLSYGNEFYHPRTKKVISFDEMRTLIELDLDKKIKSIIKKVSLDAIDDFYKQINTCGTCGNGCGNLGFCPKCDTDAYSY